MTGSTSSSANAAQSETLVQKVEGLFNRFDTIAPLLERLAAIIPGGQVAAGVITAVDNVGEFVEGAINGTGQTDSALLAATSISQSTGNTALDARLVAIENWIEGAGSFLSFVGKELGLQSQVPPTPVQVATTAQASVAGTGQANSAVA